MKVASVPTMTSEWTALYKHAQAAWSASRAGDQFLRLRQPTLNASMGINMLTQHGIEGEKRDINRPISKYSMSVFQRCEPLQGTLYSVLPYLSQRLLLFLSSISRVYSSHKNPRREFVQTPPEQLLTQHASPPLLPPYASHRKRLGRHPHYRYPRLRRILLHRCSLADL
jgi:hypothetical protein